MIVPQFIIARLRRDLDDAIHGGGMRAGPASVRVDASWLKRLLDAAEIANKTEQAQ